MQKQSSKQIERARKFSNHQNTNQPAEKLAVAPPPGNGRPAPTLIPGAPWVRPSFPDNVLY